jgi:hypothetical protein
MNTPYCTRDIYLSAFLVATGVPLESSVRIEGRTMFKFEQQETLSQLITNFYADKANVSPLKYGNSLKNLKALIYSKDNNNYETEHMYNNAKGNS